MKTICRRRIDWYLDYRNAKLAILQFLKTSLSGVSIKMQRNYFNSCLVFLSGLADVLQDIEPDRKLADITSHSTARLVNDRLEFEDIIPLSVLSGLGTEELRQRLRKLLT